MLTFASVNPPATSQDIASYEKLIAFKLPSDYREFLTTKNGGRPANFDDLACRVHWNGQTWADPIEEEGIDYFYKIDEKDIGLGLQATFKAYTHVDKRIPDGLIPIAIDQGGNQYLLNLNNDSYGTVHFWFKDFAVTEDDVEPDFRNVGFVANSFTEFLNCFSVVE